MTTRAAIAAALISLAALSSPLSASAQTDPHQHEQGTQAGKGSQGMGGTDGGMMGGHHMGGGMMGGQGMEGMMGMMNACPMMQGGAAHGMPHLPPGNEKLELQMHADMMKAMGDILAKYAARLPDRK